MKVLIYNNVGRDSQGELYSKLAIELEKENIEYERLSDDNLFKNLTGDAVFCLGGDGTILHVNEFANRLSIPILGINTGKLGFLCEFERDCIVDAVKAFKSGNLIKDGRICARVLFNGKEYLALNEALVQRVFTHEPVCAVAAIEVTVNDSNVLKYRGDGVIVNTPTGTTGYALAAGASILAPNTDVFMITPLAAHCLFMQHSVVASSQSEYKVTVKNQCDAGLYVDGKFISVLSKGDSFIVTKHEKPTYFLRKEKYDFFGRLYNKLKEDFGN